MITSRRTLLACLAAPLVLGAVWTIAAPILPDKPEMPEEVLSLAGIHKLRLSQREIPDLVKGHLTRERVREICVERLARGGILVEDDPDLPGIDVGFQVNESEAHPDMVGLVVVVGVYQTVRVHRLERDMTLPTVSFVGGIATTKADAADVLAAQLRLHLGHLTTAIRHATAAP